MTTRERRDLPAFLLGVCVSTFGAGRPDWGRAMLGELAHLKGRRTRVAFALGCMRSLVLTMPSGGLQRVVATGALVAGAASMAVVGTALLQYPGLVGGVRTWIILGVFMALVLAYVVAAASLASRLTDRRQAFTAVVSGAVIAASVMLVGLNVSVGGPGQLTMMLLALVPVTTATGGSLATTRSGSRRAGVDCVALSALIAGFSLFLLWAGETVTAAGQPYSPGLVRDFHTSGVADLATYAVNDSLGTGMMLFLLVPLVSLGVGVLGAEAAATRAER